MLTEETEDTSTGQSKVEERLAKWRKLYEEWREADTDDRQQAEDDNAFAYADDKGLGQWDKRAKRARSKRPVLQWNLLPASIQQVTNDARMNAPSIKVAPEDGGATTHTAEFFQDRIRHIEYDSNADTARDCAREQQVATGRGFMRVRTEWIPGTQKQRIKIQRIENQFSVVCDPAAREYDKSDADGLFIVTLISREKHIRDYGKDSVVSRMDFVSRDNPAPEWVGVGTNGEMIQIAEYWCKEWEDRTVPSDGVNPERKEKVAVIKQYVINGVEILDETTWLGSTIPIVPVWGKEAVVDGRRRTFSLIRNAKEPQRLLNLLLSNMAESTGQMPKTPYLAPIGSIAANHVPDWQNALNTPLAYLLWQEYDEAGRQLSRPERITQEPPIQALLEGINACRDGIKATMGIFSAALGDRGPEVSGVARKVAKQASDVTNFHFPDNEKRSNKYLGQILVELIPLLDKPGDMVPVRSFDGKTRLVPIGEPHPDPKSGELITHDLLSGQYGVSVSTGPTYDNQREEIEERDARLIEAQPELIWAIGPQMLRADDSPGSEERAEALERYRAVKFPGYPESEKDGEQPVPPQVQQQMAQLQQELEKTKQFAQSLHEQIQTKQPELENAVKLKQMDIDFQREKLAVDDENKKLDIASKETIERLEHDIAILKQQGDHHQELVTKFIDQQHAAQQAEADRAAAEQSQTQAQEHQASESAAGRDAAATSQQQTLDHQTTQADADRQAAADAAKSAEGAE